MEQPKNKPLTPVKPSLGKRSAVRRAVVPKHGMFPVEARVLKDVRVTRGRHGGGLAERPCDGANGADAQTGREVKTIESGNSIVDGILCQGATWI